MTQTLPKYEAVQAVSKRFQVGKGTIRHILGISESTQSRARENQGEFLNQH